MDDESRISRCEYGIYGTTAGSSCGWCTSCGLACASPELELRAPPPGVRVAIAMSLPAPHCRHRGRGAAGPVERPRRHISGGRAGCFFESASGPAQAALRAEGVALSKRPLPDLDNCIRRLASCMQHCGHGRPHPIPCACRCRHHSQQPGRSQLEHKSYVYSA